VGHPAATTYSLIGTAKLNGLDPEAYLRRVLECIAAILSTDYRNSCLGISPRFFRLISRGLKCPLRKIRGHLDPHRDFESRFCPETPAVDLVLMHYFVK
jgi:hypothetical protein